MTQNLRYGAAPDEFGQLELLYLDLYQPAGDTAASFAKRGYVTVSINYRLLEGFVFDGDPTNPAFQQVVSDAQHDAQAAVRWLRAHASQYRIDAGRIAIGGGSAGAITALMTGYHADDPGSSGNPGYPSDVGAAVSMAGAADPAIIDSDDAPAVLFHGTADTVVPFPYAQATCAAAQLQGTVCEIYDYEGVAHGGLYPTYQDEIQDRTAQFLFRELHLAP